MPRLCSSLLLSLVIASSASAVTMDWTFIGNPGNACDPQSQGPCLGAVGYAYNIGTYDVTNAQYAEFLNAKAASVLDPLGLYNTNMADPSRTGSVSSGYGGITRSCTPTCTYSAIAGREDMPVNYVSFYDAVRFANWLKNGQGSGDTETGAYTLLGDSATPSNGTDVTRNAGATIFVTSEDEWYKAAYFNGASYFAYPAGFDAQTNCVTPTAALNSANCNGAVGDLTPVGSYTDSASPYGTFDQGGNVWQWNETRAINSRGLGGGAFDTLPTGLAASTHAGVAATTEWSDIGFRLAMIPEPSTGLLVIAGLLGLAGWRRVHTS